MGTYNTSTPLIETKIGYRVRQGFVSRNASRNTCGRVQDKVPSISCWIEATPTQEVHISGKWGGGGGLQPLPDMCYMFTPPEHQPKYIVWFLSMGLSKLL